MGRLGPKWWGEALLPDLKKKGLVQTNLESKGKPHTALCNGYISSSFGNWWTYASTLLPSRVAKRLKGHTFRTTASIIVKVKEGKLNILVISQQLNNTILTN